MTTALDLISDPLADIGAIDPLESLTAAEASHGLRMLNEMLESWENESLLIYQILQENFTLVSGTQSYTIGSGATFNTARPLKIESAFVRSNSIDYPVRVLSREEYDAIAAKTVQFMPEGLYYEPSVANGRIYLYGVPDAAYVLYINSYKQLQSFSALTDVVVLPPGYVRAIKKNVSLDLAPAYNKTPSALLVSIARESKAAIKRLNSRTPTLSVAHTAFQSEGASGFNINTGE